MQNTGCLKKNVAKNLPPGAHQMPRFQGGLNLSDFLKTFIPPPKIF